MRTANLLALMVAAIFSFSAQAEAPFAEGTEYKALGTAQPTSEPDKVEVLELFWYGCPHCYELEPVLEHWLDNKPADVNFLRMPAIPTPRWEWYAKAYYTAEVLGVLEQVHKPLFKAIHKDKRKLNDAESLAAFFAEQGVSNQDFNAALNSFAVITKVSRATQLTRRYGISSVPTLVVNGKFSTNGRDAGSHERMMEVIDYLVESERADLAVVTGQVSADSAPVEASVAP